MQFLTNRRYALDATTPAGGTVDFQPGLSGTITLTTGELAISKDLTITGPGPDVITVSGNHASRVFNIATTFTVDISGLSLVNGVSDLGGGILNNGTLTVTNHTLSGNTSTTTFDPSGGGIHNLGVLTVQNVVLSNNISLGDGGGIANAGTLTVINSTISDNSADYAGPRHVVKRILREKAAYLHAAL